MAGGGEGGSRRKKRRLLTCVCGAVRSSVKFELRLQQSRGVGRAWKEALVPFLFLHPCPSPGAWSLGVGSGEEGLHKRLPEWN